MRYYTIGAILSHRERTRKSQETDLCLVECVTPCMVHGTIAHGKGHGEERAARKNKERVKDIGRERAQEYIDHGSDIIWCIVKPFVEGTDGILSTLLRVQSKDSKENYIQCYRCSVLKDRPTGNIVTILASRSLCKE